MQQALTCTYFAWEPQEGERDLCMENWRLGEQYQGFQVKVVSGDFGLVEGLARHLGGSGLFSKPEASRLVMDLQRNPVWQCKNHQEAPGK